MMIQIYILALMTGMVVAIFWLQQMIALMMMRDQELRGKYDKLVWGLIFILIAPLAPFLFVIWKKSMMDALQKDYSM